MRHLAWGTLLALSAAASAQSETKAYIHGGDELYWTPTLEQAIEMAKANNRPIFFMGYSLVPDGTTYNKLGDDYCKGVF
jgi:hypothetical protein